MAVQALRCKECKETYPLDARYVCERCFGPLEVAYSYEGIDAAEARRKIQAGPQTIWRYADFLPFAAPPQPGLPVCLTPLRVPLREAMGLPPYPKPGEGDIDEPAPLPEEAPDEAWALGFLRDWADAS